MSGTLYGVGVGPGDPELLTLKAVRLIQSCPVLAWPAPLEGEGLARTIAAPHVTGTRTEIAIRLSFRPERDDTDSAYDAAAETISGHLEAGRDVAVLCEGDPLFFGSFIYLLTRLRDRFAVEVVPGIASPMAASAVALRPLSTLEDGVAIIPATRSEAEIERLLAAAQSAVIMKVGRHLPKVRRVLDRLNLSDKALVVERATQARQRLIPLADAAEAPYFSLILVQS
ncbi:precorrin-2 C(20)-methyltransferase [Magnetospirillum aberrantis]|uniref:Precorrin-2 C(20)-methyltransferase n=1 Tax=Magnetospirillum aberrantis SpK TaxID=908842 RepID=A0A7C9QVM4_9PROT|nr:precorrin-2 C(20)-methyltransferase [Magnetospirillum aberrantis]NFV81684.1 precorrin-2 C(20)-methyltransferase [Magnetospirillum aberrantis SpK]